MEEPTEARARRRQTASDLAADAAQSTGQDEADPEGAVVVEEPVEEHFLVRMEEQVRTQRALLLQWRLHTTEMRLQKP